MRNLIKLSIVIVSIVIVSSCKKDDGSIPNNPSNPSITDTTSVTDSTTTSDTTNTGEDTTTTSTNHAPVAVDDEETTSMGKAVVINVLANDTDADGDSLSITKVIDAINGSIATEGTKITYTPNASFVGVELITYTINDGTTTATATLTISVGNNKQITTHNILNPYFGKMLEGVELNGVYGIRLNRDGTLDQMGFGLTGDGASWQIKDNGDIEFSIDGYVSSATVESYTFVGEYDGFSFNSYYKYVEHDPTSVSMYSTVDDYLDVQLNKFIGNGTLRLNSDGTFSQTGSSPIHSSSINGYWRVSLYNTLDFTFYDGILYESVELYTNQVSYNSDWFGIDLKGTTYITRLN